VKYTIEPPRIPSPPRRTGGGGFALLWAVLIPVIVLLVLYVGAFMTMLGFSILSDHTPVPAYGYWDSFWINIGLGFVLWPHLFRGFKRS